MEPKIILLLSGKRKSGKDHVAEELEKILGEKSGILRISEPIKAHYAKHLNLNLNDLLSNNSYKEKYRLDMINWSDEIRKEEPGYFCKVTCAKAICRDIWIVSDIRRKTDIEWFHMVYSDKVRTIRITTDDNVRTARGWIFTRGVDDAASECDLDDWCDWNLEVVNNNEESLKNSIEKIINLITI